MERKIAPELGQLGYVRHFVEDLCEGAPEDVKEKLVLAIDEAFTNIIQHSHPTRDVIIEGNIDREGVLLTLKDEGIGFDPTSVRSPDFTGERTGGFGLHIIKEVADRVTYVPKSVDREYNELRIFRRL